MKSVTKQYQRAVADVTAKLRKCLADCAPAIQAKYRLPNELLRLATYSAAATVAIESGKPFAELEQDHLSVVQSLAAIQTAELTEAT